MPRKIFISYRRDDVRAEALRIYDKLAAKYRPAGVFMDVRDLSAGQVFNKVIASALDRSDVLLAIIGPNWAKLLSARMAAGASDLVRKEISSALEQSNIIIPVLIDETPLPDANSLPDDIRALLDHQAVEVRFESFDDYMKKITVGIDEERRQRVRNGIRNHEQLWLWLRRWQQVEVSRAIAARGALRDLPWACGRAERFVQHRAQAVMPPPVVEQAGEDPAVEEAMQAVRALELAQLESTERDLLNEFRASAAAWFAAVGSKSCD